MYPTVGYDSYLVCMHDHHEGDQFEQVLPVIIMGHMYVVILNKVVSYHDDDSLSYYDLDCCIKLCLNKLS